MFIFIYISLFCLFAILFIFGLNWYENKKGINLISSEFRLKSDNFFKNKISFFVKAWVKIHDYLRKALKDLPHKTAHFIHEIWKKVSVKIDKYFEKIKNAKKFDK
jgi:hypothetical protein